ncbi:MAG: 4-carboxy-4-hydroxy-2-oxoadipate aldolase/oxaloacetate decarboxylase [Actinobacteria bacterium]|nr:4-carboxy-4-hydroxy-2-oxoadipate aldolase/oxaloacetate decarboxylase [Actinomycetota bacterium]
MELNLRDRLSRLDTCALSDALDELGLPGAAMGLSSITLPDAAVVGRVRTVEVGPRVDGEPQAHVAAELVDIAEPGDVIVIANSGHEDVSCWGGLLGRAAALRGVAGVIVDGVFRDVAENAGWGLAVFARGAVPRSARGRVVQVAMDDRVNVCGVRVDPGDWVVADRSGVVFVQGIDAERVLDIAERIVMRESLMLTAVELGHGVTDVMHDERFAEAVAR